MTPRRDTRSTPITEDGLADVARLVVAALGWKGMSQDRLGKMSGRVSITTIQRVTKGERVSEAMLRSLGELLDLPRDFLLYVAYRDIDSVVRAGLAKEDTDLVRWTAELMIGDHTAPIDVRAANPRTQAVLREMGFG